MKKEEESKTEKLLKNGLTILVFVILSFFIFKSFYATYQINNSTLNYTIGEIVSFHRGARVAPNFRYIYYYDNIKHKGRYSIIEDLRNKENDYLEGYIGQKFIVKFTEDNEKISYLKLNCPVLDTIEAPPNGWKEIPCNIIAEKCLKCISK